MNHSGRTTPEQALDAAAQLVAAPPAHLLEHTSRVLRRLVPHTVAAQLSEASPHAPARAAGAEPLASRVTGAELGRISVDVRVGTPWQGTAVLGGERHRVLGVAAAPRGTGTAALLVLGGVPAEPVAEPVLGTVQRLWDLATVHSAGVVAEAYPEHTALSGAAAAARDRALTELADVCTVSLNGVLSALRSPSLDDARARAAATEAAVDALSRLRGKLDWHARYTEERATDAFRQLVRELRPVFRHAATRLVLRPPAEERTLPAEVAHTARAVARAAVLALLEQEAPAGRTHVGWWTEQMAGGAGAARLRAAVRDDGAGRIDPAGLLSGPLAERVAALGGSLAVDAVPDWGTTVTATLPLTRAGAATAAGPHPLEGLHPRELEVLEQLTLGRRNREIAGRLHISPSTVKFHVANILNKLGVSTRGEAAALALRPGTAGGRTTA